MLLVPGHTQGTGDPRFVFLGIFLAGAPRWDRRRRLVPLLEALSNFDPTLFLGSREFVATHEITQTPGQTALKQPNRKLKPAEVQEVVAAYGAGTSLAELARTWGRHEQTVKAHLRRSGMRLRPVQVLTDDQVTQIVERYVAGSTIWQLHEEFAVSEDTVRRKLVGAGVTMRPRGRRQRRS